MPLLVVQPIPISSVPDACGSTPPPAAAAAHDDDDGILFDDLVLGGGSDDKTDADADDPTGKLAWLRSQVIGAEAEFASPFGTRRVTYADHTASGRCLRFVEEFVQRNVLPYYGNTHTMDSYVGLHTSKLAMDAAKYVKRSLGAGPEDVLLFCGTGCTAAIKRLQEVTGMAVPPTLRSVALDVLPTSERWVVFVGPYEHHSNLLTWRESLAEVVEIGLRPDDGHLDLDALEAALAAPERAGRPLLGSFSACSNVTGIRTDTRAVARLLHSYGAYACFDFACSAPYVGIDMRSAEEDGYDAVYLSPHKFLGGPGSPGVLAMAKRLYRLRRTAPSTSGGGTVVYVSAYGDTVYCEDTEEREDAGTPAIIQKVRAALAFRVKEWVGEACIEAREDQLLALALSRMQASANPNLRLLLGGDRPSSGRCLPVLSFVVHPPSDCTEQERGAGAVRPQLHCRFVTKLLNDLFGVQARGGCSCAGPYGHRLLGITPARAKAIKSAVEMGYHGVRPGWTRVSLAYYTSTQEAEFVLDAIDFVASFGHRDAALLLLCAETPKSSHRPAAWSVGRMPMRLSQTGRLPTC
uniref:Aminotransferase class V domain-containing protein n=1 Tax=Oryza brachyantha TaxID=4533 RepID=J3L3Q6_ORYBR